MKKCLYIVLVCALLAAFTACGGGETPTEPAPTFPPETEAVPTETQPTVDPFAEDDLIAQRELMHNMQAAFDAALDYVVEGDTLTPAEKASNAILKATSYEILSAADGVCKVKVSYPDAYNSYMKVIEQLPENATEQEIAAVTEAFAQSLENMEIAMIEEVIDVNYVIYDRIATIQWTDPLYNAFSGGFYNAFNIGVG